jgi:hypothetical protein
MSGIASCLRPLAFAQNSALKGIFLALLTFGAFVVGTDAATAQNAPEFQRSYINPFPKGDRYRVLVLGDSLGDGLWSGLYRTFDEDKNLEIVNRSKVSTGFVRVDYYDWNKALDDILKENDYQMTVVMFGANDNQPIRQGKEFFKPGTDAWREAYGQRVEAFIKKLRAAKLAVYWAGLPIMRSPDQSDDAQFLNDVFREKAFINGAKFVDTWSGFTDDSGRYSAYGPDMEGQVKRLRADDGVHFTMRGYLKLAHFVEKEMRHDLNIAKLERSIPLAGDAQEQAKMMGRAVNAGPTATPPAVETPVPPVAEVPDSAVPPGDAANAAPAPDAANAASTADAAAPGANPGPPAVAQEQAKAGDVALVRPAIAATTLEAAQTMSPQGVGSAMPESETISSDLPDGLTALSSISSASDLSGSSKPKLPLTERPYYKVLIEGEQLKPKAGRADDFAWPRS